MKRIIRTIPVEMHLANQAVIYDGMEDVLVPDDFDHTAPGVLYAAIDTPIMGEDGEGNQIIISHTTELVPPHWSVSARNTFGLKPGVSWPIVGQVPSLD